MRYFRAYPLGLQLFLFLVLWFTLWSTATSVMFTVFPKFTGLALLQIENINPGSPASLVHAALVVQGLSNLFMFLVPAFLFAYLCHPTPAAYLGLRPAGKKIQWVLVAFVIIGAIPVLEKIDELLSLVNFGPKVKEMQAENDNIMSAFLNMPDTVSFIRTFIVMALVPAVGEEMFFRGILMRFIKKRTHTMVVPVLGSALVFAIFHSNIYGLPSIFTAGILLALIYNLTGSLWCSIFAHLLFNGLQIILSFAGRNNPAMTAFLASDSISYTLVAGGAILFGISFYLLLKNKTPLTANWTDDFAPDELPGFDFGEKK